jgi:PIN domain nuclease of toxin-antitoxin system
MAKVVLDASAVLAVLQKEPGAEAVLSHLHHAVISAVNFSEVVARIVRGGDNFEDALTDLHNLFPDIHPFGIDQALAVGRLFPQTVAHGLSFGDRACLVLAKSLGAPALTADQEWAKLDIGVKVELIRPVVA